MRSFEKVAVSFASALLSGEFERARTFLAPALHARLTGDQLRERFFGMSEGYAEGTPASIEFEDGFSLTDWPSRQPGDVGWAYVGIMGEDFLEAVSVTVCAFDGVNLIREIEWGRP